MKFMNNQKIITMSVESALFSLFWPNTLVIASPTSVEKLDEGSQNILQWESDHVLHTNNLSFDTILTTVQRDHSNISTVVAIGGGTAIDYAKYVSKHLDLECVVIPSMLSTNAFATDKVAVYADGGKHTEWGKLPDTIILSMDYLNQSSRENLYGLVDVFSIYNALRDWEYAQNFHNEIIALHIWSRATQLLHSALELAYDYLNTHQLDITQLFHVIQEAGYITNDYGSGRPESGSEHIFASALESKIKIPHALAVTLGMYIMEFLSKYAPKTPPVGRVCSFSTLPFDQLGLISDINAMDLNYDMIYNVLCDLRPRHDKFTMVDLVKDVQVDYRVLGEYLQQYKFEFVYKSR